MSKFHASVRELLEDVHSFLTSTIQNEVLCTASLTHKERLLSRLKCLQNEYPELHLQFNETEESKSDSKRCSTASPLPYVDMNGGSPYKMPFFPTNVDQENYDICSPKDKYDSSENQSVTGSEDYASEDAKLLPEIPASDLYVCEKAGYLDKKKREVYVLLDLQIIVIFVLCYSIKGWLNPFQRRWCAIKDNVLYYYEKTTDRKQKGCIILTGYEARSLPDDSKEGKKYNFCFELVCPGKRTYQFSAPSEKDLHQWISAVERNSKILNQGKSGNKESFSYPCSVQSVNHDNIPSVPEDIYETVDEENTILDNDSENINNQKELNESPLLEDQTSQDHIFNYSDLYVGLWDCSGADDTELSFYRGDLIHVVSKEYDSFAWWIGELQGKIGFVPKSYLMEAYECY
ncbi:src kinase-associated phosphoprotein 2 [Caerostris extrusa]|uniref:Src kinase-associated phosphoprotein 2 n=1 Tax=Caerostris extrusa TaxID=172846 RepID=A0AAV4XK42_CAEEX|nr:src kinase-associated phosphoprotein 2 [Caerostris extrusa]